MKRGQSGKIVSLSCSIKKNVMNNQITEKVNGQIFFLTLSPSSVFFFPPMLLLSDHTLRNQLDKYMKNRLKTN